MFKVGLTGGIGSGKTTAANLFAEQGIKVIDADKISRELVTQNTNAYKEIITHFGPTILGHKKEIDRQKLREIIFKKSSEKSWLEDLLHPLIYQEMEKLTKQIDSPYCILVIPLLFETAHETAVDRILVIDASMATQTSRVMQRYNVTKTQAERIVKIQMERTKRLYLADDIVHNNGSLAHLKKEIIKLHNKYLKMAQTKEKQ